MTLKVDAEILRQIKKHAEAAYPEEGAGLLLGIMEANDRLAQAMLPFKNAREAVNRHHRYLIGPEDYLQGELEASRLELEVIGVFHSHPDHPDRPSEVDLEWALPGFSYLITSVQAGQANGSRSWRLSEDRSSFIPEPLMVQ